jgi:hypothetical protein
MKKRPIPSNPGCRPTDSTMTDHLLTLEFRFGNFDFITGKHHGGRLLYKIYTNFATVDLMTVTSVTSSTLRQSAWPQWYIFCSTFEGHQRMKERPIPSNPGRRPTDSTVGDHLLTLEFRFGNFNFITGNHHGSRFFVQNLHQLVYRRPQDSDVPVKSIALREFHQPRVPSL